MSISIQIVLGLKVQMVTLLVKQAVTMMSRSLSSIYSKLIKVYKSNNGTQLELLRKKLGNSHGIAILPVRKLTNV